MDAIEQYKNQLTELEKQRVEINNEVNNRWGSIVNEISEVTVNPKKTDVFLRLFGVAWVPYYIVRAGAETIELPAFGAE